MTKKKEQFDEDLDLGVSPEFSADLNALFKPHFSVPPEVDRAVMDRAYQHFVRRDRRRLFSRVSLWRIAAAAAVIIFLFTLTDSRFRILDSRRVSSIEHRASRVDIDRNGRVDILDAFKLARHVESSDRSKTNLSPVSGTGQALRKQGWDINGDGLVNRNDVDLVASAAVRLPAPVLPAQKTRVQVDKGVL